MAVNRELATDYIRRWGGLIFCKACHHVSPAGPSQNAKYLHSGWPKCCGETMVLVIKFDDPMLQQHMNTD